MVRALLYFLWFSNGWVYLYIQGLLHCHSGHRAIAPEHMKYIQNIRINWSYKSNKSCSQNKTKHNKGMSICAGNSPVTGEFPSQKPVTRNFDVLFDLHLNKRLSKQPWGWKLRRHGAHYDVILMLWHIPHQSRWVQYGAILNPLMARAD